MGQDTTLLIHILTPTGISLCGIKCPEISVGIQTLDDDDTPMPSCAQCLVIWAWTRQ